MGAKKPPGPPCGDIKGTADYADFTDLGHEGTKTRRKTGHRGHRSHRGFSRLCVLGEMCFQSKLLRTPAPPSTICIKDNATPIQADRNNILFQRRMNLARPLAAAKSEALNPKFETNSKPECSNDQNEDESRISQIIGIWA